MEGERDFRKTAVEKRARGTWREMWRRRRRKRERERERASQSTERCAREGERERPVGKIVIRNRGKGVSHGVS